MARSLDGLIRHLVDQVALCGEHGATPLDFITHIKHYYQIPIEGGQPQDGDHPIPHTDLASNVDRPLLEQVWKWLLRNPEIRLGGYAGLKQLTLSEVEARNAAIEQPRQLISISQETDLSKNIAPSEASNAPNIVQDGDVTQTQQTAKPLSARTKNAAVPPETKFNPGIRLYASNDRMWHALTGHAPDSNKIKSLDFICLSIIAACGPKGILQPDLVRISGQDKRSLPARTDRLHSGGYIEKRSVSVELENPPRLLNTSKCTLKRFANGITTQTEQTSDQGSTSARTAKRAKKKTRKDRPIQMPGQSFSTVAQESVTGSTALSETTVAPLWTADRPMNNQIFELVDRAGIKGMTMVEIRDALMGDHVKKPLEEYVSRLVQSWQISQPLHIRHLSIVRDTVLKGKTQIYKYYTYENFKKLVEGGTGFWEAVTTIPSEVTISSDASASLTATPNVDEYGFPRLEESLFQGRHNDATLEECVSALKFGPLHICASDPVLKKQADGNYGVWYKSQRQNSVIASNGPSPKKAVSTPSQAAPVKSRVTEPSKVSLSTPLGDVSPNPHIVELEKDAVSTLPGIVPVNGRALGSQVQRRKHATKPDSKPRGRPRKYPKTGIPANFDTMTPDEVEYLIHSQEMFEKYEIVKIEKEIVRRVEEGGKAAIVAYEVLAECDNSRRRERELPLPKTSREHVLHKFAGEPLPEADPYEAKSKSRQKNDARYRPSMAAHTYFIPTIWKQTSHAPGRKDPEERPPVLPSRTRRRGQVFLSLGSKKYYPSVAAHSWPDVPPSSSAIESSATDGLHNVTKHGQGRAGKVKQLLGPHSNDSPSVTAQSASSLPLDTLFIARAGQKRKRNTHAWSQHDEHHTTPSASSAATQNPCVVSALGASLGASNMQLMASDEGMYPGWEKFMSKYYLQQLGTIRRENTGVFFGETTPRRKRPCEPRDFRPMHFKLVVFKSTRLSELDWFMKEAIASNHMSPIGSRAQTPRSQIAEPVVAPIAQSSSEEQPELSTSRMLPSPSPSHQASQTRNSYISPYVDSPGVKRKRATSARSARGAAPFDHFSANQDSRLSSPRTEPVRSVSRQSTPSRAASMPPAIDNAHESEHTKDEAPTTTSEKLSSMRGLHEPTPNAPDLNDPNTTQNQSATDRGLQSSQTFTPEINKLSDKESISRISRGGGSTAMLRKNIIMEIIEKCEGVFPGYKEMSLPFAAEWKQRGQQGTPESKTISNAVNALINEQKLRQITFAAQTRQGAVVTKNMLILPAIDTADPKVKEIQTNIVAYHPRHFIPMAVLPRQDYRNTEIWNRPLNSVEALDEMPEGGLQTPFMLEAAEVHRRNLAKRIMDGKEKAAMARLKALKGPDQQGSGYTDREEPSTKTFESPAIEATVHVVSGSGREILPEATSKRSGGRRGQKRVERLASVRKRKPSQLIPLPKIPFSSAGNSVPLTWLPSEYAFSDSNFEESRPALLMATDNINLQTRTLEAQKYLDPSSNSRQRMREMAENAARIERQHAKANSTRSSLLRTSVDSGQLDSSDAATPPTSTPWLAPTCGIITFARQTSQPILYTPPRATGATLNRPVRSGDNLGLETVGLEPVAQIHPNSENLSSTTSSSPSIHIPEWSVVAHGADHQRLNQRILLVSFMDPIHYFHRATGTFSVTFSGLRPPRKVLARRGTASNPYAASLKLVQPYNSYRRNAWPSSLQGSQKIKKRLFDEEVDGLLRRELETHGGNNVILQGWPFINHLFPHAHQTVQSVEADMEAAKQVTVRLKDGHLVSQPLHSNNASRLTPRQRINTSIFSTGSRDIGPANAESRPSLKRRRLTSVIELGTPEVNTDQVDLDHENRLSKLRRVRGPRQVNSLGENGEERLLTAVMVVRALTGGLDKRIDWVLVAKVFEPTYTQMFVHSRWRLTLQKYKLVLPKMESDFQSIFTSAYEKGTVPPIDYENLEDYDWKWLVDWTMVNVDTPTQSLPELPVERSDFDALYTLNESSSNEINEFYEIDGSSALARRTKIMNRDPYVLPLVRRRQRAHLDDSEELIVAKSWIRANIITLESTYNPSAARAKLATFPDRTVEDALKQLLLDRILTQENKGRLVPGRNYDISDFLISRLKKNLQAHHFHRAAAYKQQLDHEFEEKGFANYTYAVDDGDMIVVVNLQAHRRITVLPIGVPMNKWGQTDGGYETRQMNKKRLNFSLKLRPSPTYVYGNPLSPLPAPPSQHLQDRMAKIPLWYDIHGSLVRVMWEMALAAVIAVLAVRPGIGATELEEVMRPAMEIWELQMVLDWLVHTKAAKSVGEGFSVADEWWWLALGIGQSSEKCLGEDAGDKTGITKAKGKEKEQEGLEEGVEEGAEDVTSMNLD